MIKSKSIVYDKAYKFGIKVFKVYRYLMVEKKEFVISKQVLRSATSVAANIKEALRGQTTRDFLAKMNISLKEANETEYWLEFMIDTELINRIEGELLLKECREICRVLNSIVNTTKKKINFKEKR